MERPSNEYLLERFGGHAGYCATIYVKRNPALREELMSTADMAIFIAADGFDWEASENCYGFGAYLNLVVREECREVIAEMGYATSGSARSLANGSVFHGRGSVESYEYSQGYEWDDSSDAESIEMVRELAERVLSPRQYEAFARYYFDGICSDSHVAEMLGVSQQAASMLRKKAEDAIRKNLEES